MNQTGKPLGLSERHKAFLHDLARKDRDGAMRHVEALVHLKVEGESTPIPDFLCGYFLITM